MAISQAQANELAAAYQSGDTSGLQGLVSQYGVTGADVQQYFPGFDVGTQAPGITLADATGGQSTPDYGANVAQAYQDVFGRQADTEGLNYWTQQLAQGNITQQDLANQLAYGAQGSDIIGAQQYLDKYIFDPTQTVQQAYQSVFGREADQPGAEYWASQIQSGAVTPDDLLKYLAEGSTGLEDRLKAQQYLGQDIFAPEEFLTKTKGAGYQDTIQYITENIDDPVKVYQMANSLGVTPDDIYAAYQAVNPSAGFSLQQIQDYFGTGQQGFESRLNDLVSQTFGDETAREALADLVAVQAGVDPERISFSDIFKQDPYSKMSIEDITSNLQQSGLNKLQAVNTLGNVAQNYFGMGEDDLASLLSGVASGEGKNELANKAYKELLETNTISNDTQNELLTAAAQYNPDAPIFQQNPDLLTLYTPIGETSGGRNVAGQYGYYNGAPILSADELNKMMGNQMSKGSQYDAAFDYGNTIDDKLGWDLSSKYGANITQGAGLYGVTEDYDAITSILNLGDKFVAAKEAGKAGDNQQDLDKYFATTSDSETGTSNYKENYDKYIETVGELNAAAEKLGLNPASYASTKDLLDAVNEKEQRVVVTGRTQAWDPAKNEGVGGLNEENDRTHARVVYDKVGDKYVPVKVLDTFDFEDPKRSGVAAQLAKLGPIAPIALSLALPGAGSALAGALGFSGNALATALATGALGGGISDLMGGDFWKGALTTGFGSYAGSPEFSKFVGTTTGITDPAILKAITNVAPAVVGTAVHGGDVEDYLRIGLGSLISNAFSGEGTMDAKTANTIMKIAPYILKGGLDDKDVVKLAASLAQSAKG